MQQKRGDHSNHKLVREAVFKMLLNLVFFEPDWIRVSSCHPPPTITLALGMGRPEAGRKIF